LEDEDNTKRNMALGIAVIVLLAGGVIINVPIGAGWETDANFSHFVVNDTWRAYVGDSAATVGIQSGSVGYDNAFFKIDDGIQSDYNNLDWPRYTGTTKLSFELSGPTHVNKDATGNWMPVSDDVVFQTYSKNVSGVVYEYDHHVYEVDLMVFTVGESIMAVPNILGDLYLGTCDGMPSRAYTATNPDGSTFTIYTDRDHSAEFMSFIDFEITPWDIYVGQQIPIANSTDYWVVESEFVGVMSASVIAVTPSQVGDSTPTIPGKAIPYNQEGYQVNMYSIDDNTLIQQKYDSGMDGEESNLGDISGIQESVRLQLSGALEPGLIHTSKTWPAQGWASATPVQYQIQYRVRVDVLTAAGYSLVSGEQPTGTTEATIVEPPDVEPFDFWKWLSEFFDSLNIGDPLGATRDILVLVVIGLFAIFALKWYWGRDDSSESGARRG